MYRIRANTMVTVICSIAVAFLISSSSGTVEVCAEKDGTYSCPDFKENCTKRINSLEKDCEGNPCDAITICDETRFDGPMCCVDLCGNCMAVFYCNGNIINCFEDGK